MYTAKKLVTTTTTTRPEIRVGDTLKGDSTYHYENYLVVAMNNLSGAPRYGVVAMSSSTLYPMSKAAIADMVTGCRLTVQQGPGHRSTAALIAPAQHTTTTAMTDVEIVPGMRIRNPVTGATYLVSQPRFGPSHSALRDELLITRLPEREVDTALTFRLSLNYFGPDTYEVVSE